MPGFWVLDHVSYFNVPQHMRRRSRPGHRHQHRGLHPQEKHEDAEGEQRRHALTPRQGTR